MKKEYRLIFNLFTCHKLMKKISQHFKKIIEAKNPLRAATIGILYRTKLCKYFIFEKENLKFRFNPSAASINLWKDPNYYDEILRFYRLFLKPGDVFVDVGANIGLVSLIAGKIVGQKGLVIAIEGFPTTYLYLEENIRLNKGLNIKSYNCAIGLEETYASFLENKVDDSQNYISESGSVQIPLCRLDNIINFLDHVDLLKIDVEGYEKFVILSTTKMLERINTIEFESYQVLQSRYKYTLDEIIDVLKSFGFTILRFKNDKTMQIVEKGYISTTSENLIATRDCHNLLNRTQLKIADV